MVARVQGETVMLGTAEDALLGLIDPAAAAASRMAAPEDAETAAFFVAAFYRNVPPDEIRDRSPETLAQAAVAMLELARERQPGRPIIEIVGGSQGLVRIVNDDMGFLVDSVTAALMAQGLEVDLVIHPVLSVTRDPAGRLVGFARAGEGHGESMMHIELVGPLEPDRKPAVAARLEAVLADVRAAVADGPDMQAIARRTAAEIAVAGPAGAIDPAEDAALLQWLDTGNFLFLGSREYSLAGNELAVVAGSGRGLLRRDDVLVFDGLRALTRSSPDVQAFLRGPQVTMISKTNRRSTVHRRVPMDTILVKRSDAAGTVIGLRLLLGLFTEDSYARRPHEIPVLRQKVRRCRARSGFDPEGRDGRALQQVLDNFPRDELFQIDEDQLFETAVGVLHLKQRPRVALFLMRDPFERFVTCLVYLPRERFNAEVVRRIGSILEQALDGGIRVESTHFEDAALARLHFVIATMPGYNAAPVAASDLEARLREAVRSWADRLGEALLQRGLDRASALRRYGSAFPAAYVDRSSAADAVADMALVDRVLAGEDIAVALSEREGGSLRLKIFHPGEPLALSDVLPVLENLGLLVLNEIPFEITPRDAASTVWLQDFELRPRFAGIASLAEVRPLFEDAFRLTWAGRLENDGFNRLVLLAGLSAREVTVLRTYCKLLRQAGSQFSQAYMEDTLCAWPTLARALVALFLDRSDPALDAATRAARSEATLAAIAAALDEVENLDEDRIMRGFLLLITRTLRTNYFQTDSAGEPKPYLAVKLASREVDLLPLPRPLMEIFVYSPRVEGCHLRGGRVARGGIRWSDRREDFRTEVLGLMKAQMVKNSVIVPIGSKGGFFVKRPPQGGRDALMAEVVACYKTLMCGLLDLTDNIVGSQVVPPASVVRHDSDDTYLVVAADKGTATFSDIANSVSIDYGFWLGDAFASGGSVGYDHKAMGITAKGAWEAVKRHFREVGRDIQAQDFTCVGVGDMSGDVFGNGMLLSRHIRLVAAFNHLHIFIDPDPDPARSWAERKRLFDLPRSGWQDYDLAVLSPGGAVFDRKAKSVTLSPQACARLGLDQATMTPNQLIQALLRQDVDLLWFGGIGTYVKAGSESHAQAGDRANDALRVDAAALRARVVGEGANLAVTQRARIEFALRGGRINTDAIDNSAGVDTSDHEVNIKIGVGDAIGAGLLAAADRAAFLASMTQEVEHLVLRDNYLQTLALTLAEAEAPALLDSHARLMRAMERRGQLDRAVEFLPDDEALTQRAAAGRGLTRPEIAVLLAYAKNGLYATLLASPLPDNASLESELLAYFPAALRQLAPTTLRTHRLRREIIATALANALVNRMGPDFVEDMQSRTGRAPDVVTSAWLIACQVLDVGAIWRAIEALDNAAAAATQTRLLLSVASVVEQAVLWFLRGDAALDPVVSVARFRSRMAELERALDGVLDPREQQGNAARIAALGAEGVPEPLARRLVALPTLGTAMDILEIAEASDQPVAEVARTWFAVGEAFGLLLLRRQARQLPAATEWQRIAADTLTDAAYAQQREIVRRQIDGGGPRPDQASLQDVLTEVARTSPPDLAMLTVASRRIGQMLE
jgi:glutamate dehydrogenase